ncbi:response regulator transcription factor [Spirilliplanes yamanashiensis]|nr:response regulator transcription factor [Spirilliplanes yamanashiensis]MDP9818090.1 DNA-binding NarL/FixJ family response regulator [Spirilliplanes yamanashiensis]
MQTAIRVLIVDSEQALAQGLAEALVHQPGIAAARAAHAPPAAGVDDDVVVAATDSEGWDALALIRDLAGRENAPAVVAISGDSDPERVAAAVAAGAISWAPKEIGLEQLAGVVVAAARGEAWLPPAVLARVLRVLAAGGGDAAARENPIDRLTVRERQILEFTARGLSRREIAAKLDVSVNTVRSHSQHMLSKLGVHTTLEAVALALREGAVTDRP